MINNVVLMGRLTQTPELKTTQQVTTVVSFTIAIDRRFQNEGKKQTDFINCVAWRQTAEFISRFFGKGDLIAVTGEIQTRKYEYEGQNRIATEVIVNNASFCGGKNSSKETDTTPTFDDMTEADEYDDDLPF